LRVLGGVDSGGAQILSFSYYFHGFATFRAFCWSCGFSFFKKMAFLSFSLAFGHLSVLHGVLDSRFKLCAVIVNGLIKGRLRNHVVSSLV
jgi:hypothetical protein